MSLDVRLTVILDPASRNDAVAAARAAEAGGATILQVRMKNSAAGSILRSTEELVRMLSIPVFVNDRLDIALASGAAGVHLGADDLPLARARALAPAPFAIGVSVGDDREVALARDGDPDYWSVGSVYATDSKADAGAPIGARGFWRVARQAPAGVPVVAIGGVTADRVPEICAAGADGVAVINAVFGDRDPERAAREIRDAVDASGG